DRRLVDPRLMIGDGASGRAPATTVGNTAKLLDVHVHQLTRVRPLVALSGLSSSADQLAGERIAVREVWHVMPPQNRADRAWWDTQLGTDPILAAPLLPPHL